MLKILKNLIISLKELKQSILELYYPKISFSRKLDLFSVIVNIIRSGIIISCLIGIFLATIFTPWIQDNLLVPDSPSYSVSRYINLNFDQIWYEPRNDSFFSRGGKFHINWVSNGYINFYLLNKENFDVFQEGNSRFLTDFQSIFEDLGVRNLTKNIQIPLTDKYYLVWYYSPENYAKNLKLGVNSLYLDYKIYFPPSSYALISPLIILVVFTLMTYFLLVFIISVKKYALSPSLDTLDREEIYEYDKKDNGQPQLCLGCYAIILGHEIQCYKCGKEKFENIN